MRLNPLVAEEAARRIRDSWPRGVVPTPLEWERLLHAVAYDLHLPFCVPDAAEPDLPSTAIGGKP